MFRHNKKTVTVGVFWMQITCNFLLWQIRKKNGSIESIVRFLLWTERKTNTRIMAERLRLTKVLSKIRIKHQLYFIYTAVVVIPVILIGTFLLFHNYRMMIDYHEDLLESDNRRVKNILFEITTQIL